MQRSIDQKQHFEGKKVLITGGAGFIGSTLGIRLAALGAQVTAIDSLIPEYGGNLRNLAGHASEITLNIADVRDQHGLNFLVRDHDYLFNLAGQTSHLDSMTDPFTDLEINCHSQLKILEACRQNNPKIRIVYASTRQIYGRPQYLPVDEKHPLNPVDVNGINKLAGEMYHLLYAQVYQMSACALRLTNTYGPRMRVKDTRQTFLGIWIRNLIQQEPLQVYGDGQQLRDFNYVDDVVEALLLAATHHGLQGRAYNLGGGEVISLEALAQLAIKISGTGKMKKIPFPPERKAIDIGDYYANYDAFKQLTGWSPQVNLKTGLQATLEYFRAQGRYYWDEELASGS
ncbi:MAG: NAD-dependent epimerase/dehydratase [Chloroflexi bacterium OLB15]|nr:MAG: NAD-dependent epimerase/dehydratase [Chloroflexi bacterium OLB15]